MLRICVRIRHVVSQPVMSRISMGHVAHMCVYTSCSVAARRITHMSHVAHMYVYTSCGVAARHVTHMSHAAHMCVYT